MRTSAVHLPCLSERGMLQAEPRAGKQRSTEHCQMCGKRAETRALLPHWVILEASSVALKLRSEQATCHFFCDLAGLLAAVAQACVSPGAPSLSLPWPPVAQNRSLKSYRVSQRAASWRIRLAAG